MKKMVLIGMDPNEATLDRLKGASQAVGWMDDDRGVDMHFILGGAGKERAKATMHPMCGRIGKLLFASIPHLDRYSWHL